MPHLRMSLSVLFLCLLAARGVAEPTSPPVQAPRRFLDNYAFIQGYKISHYLDAAVELQKLEPAARAARLRELAHDPNRASEVYPLCRMIFQEKVRNGFHRPPLGLAGCVGRTEYRLWPLEPITIYQGVPILIVTGYSSLGSPELPEIYVDYCLSYCAWRDRKYAS
jgi:hypothetical protein